MPDINQAPWITYIPALKVLDCTIRDGGLVNDHQFDDTFVRAVYEACLESGVDYMEIGYRASRKVFAPGKHGPWKYCDDTDIWRIIGDKNPRMKLAVMADSGDKTDWKADFGPAEKSPFDLVRVATYVHQMPEAIDMVKYLTDLGYETSCNVMSISAVQDAEIDTALALIRESPAQTVVVVDSFGALNPLQVRLLVKRYLDAMEGTGKEVGIHAHNNLQLAFANTIEAFIHGATRVDATIGGLGRGSGNCPMELLLGLLRNPKFHVRPIWKVLQEHFVPLRQKIEWGPFTAYNITGQLNQHPRSAISWRAGEKRENCLDFYDKSMSDV